MAGVPFELVQKLTRQKATDIVLKHDFRPGRNKSRLIVTAAMPKLLTKVRERRVMRSKAGRPRNRFTTLLKGPRRRHGSGRWRKLWE